MAEKKVNEESLPEDVRETLDEYDANVKDGVVIPWNPDDDPPRPPEYNGWVDAWLTAHLHLDS